MPGTFDLQIHNDQSHVEIDDVFLTTVVCETLQAEGIDAAEISLAFVDDAAIHRVNRDFLQHDFPTDVISFRLDDPAENLAIPGGFAGLQGEIVVSAETAARRAGDFGWSPRDEIVLYVVHGLLHLAGYDDRTPDDRRRMQDAEISNLSRWNLTPRYDARGGGLEKTAETPPRPPLPREEREQSAEGEPS